MNRKLLPLVILGLLLGQAITRAGLTFSIVPPGTVNKFDGFLNAVALGTNSLASVGSNTTVLTATLTNADIDLFTSNAWTQGSVPTNKLNLLAITYGFGPGFFVASGTSNLIFTSINGSLWTANSNALGARSSVNAQGLAFAGTNFVLAPSTVDIRYSGAASVGATWSDAVNVSNAFLESYRAVTTYGSNAFALCGVSGTVRYSTNDGTTWYASQPYNFGDSNYLGIATDGSSNIVCVGESGTIKYCTNGGFSYDTSAPGPTNTSWFFAARDWQTNLARFFGLTPPLNSSALELNAVSYAGASHGFLAAGSYKASGIDFGFLILSTNYGANWDLQTNFLANEPSAVSVITNGPQTNMYTRYLTNAFALTNHSLLGTSFGINTNLVMGDLAIIVGEGGEVIVGGDIPAAPTNPISQTNYAGFQSSNLSVTVPVYVTADWYWLDPSNNLVLVTNGAVNYSPPPIPNWFSTAIYTSNYVVYARDARTSFVSTNSVQVTLVTRPRPTASGSYLTNICNGENAELNTILSGLGPDWNKLIWSDGTNETPTTANWTRLVFAPEITNNLFDNIPSNYVFTVTNLFDQYTNVIAYPSGPVTYPNLPGDLISTNTIVVNPLPKATILGTNTVCAGQPFIFTILLKGQAPWTVQLSDGSTLNVSSAFVTNTGPTGWAAATNVTRFPGDPLDNCPVITNYFVTSVSDNSGCSSQPGDITGTAQATVNPRPHVAVIGTNSVCNGQPFNFTVLLKGQAPWTVSLSDGSTLTVSNAFVTNLSCTGWAAATNVTRFPTNFLDNCQVATNYFAVAVTDLATGCTNDPSDLLGSAQAIVIPRPKAAVVGTNNAVCNGSPFTFTVLLAGEPPWTVQLSDSSTITVAGNFVTNSSCSGWAAATNVTRFPTNSSLNTTAVTNYFALSVDNNKSGCTNDPGDITGFAQATVIPRPTAVLISSNLPNNLFGATNCGGSTTSYTITNVFTGFGPWTITWSSNGQAVVESVTNLANGGVGPYTNTFLVFPTSTADPNAAVTNVYFISNIADTNGCLSSLPGDILGTNVVVVYPTPSLNLSVGTNDFASRRRLRSGTTRTVAVSSNSAGVFFVQTAFDRTTNTLFITNHIQLTGVSPLNEQVIWQEVGADPAQLNLQTVYFTNTYNSASAVTVISDKLYQSTPGTNFTIMPLLVSNLNTTCSAPLTGSIQVFANASNSVVVGINGLDTNQESICGDGSQTALIEADLGGSPPWTVYWNDGTTNIVGSVTNLPLVRTNFLTNTTMVPFTNVYWVTNVVDSNSTNSFSSNDTGIAVIVVDPIDTNAPLSLGNVTNCSDVAVPLTVVVPAGFTADWYDNTLTNLLASSTTNFVQSVTNVPGTNTYYVVARFDDPDLTNTCVSPYANITEVTVLCTNQISSITLSGTNAIVQWSGDYILLQSSNLAQPYWTVVTQGGIGLNLLTSSVVPPPTNDFFRLFAPTNYPYPTNFGP